MSFGTGEWARRKPDEPALKLHGNKRKGQPPVDLPVVSPKVPLQMNSCDCGVFVLRYAQEFLQRAAGPEATVAVTERDVATKFGDHDFEGWFKPADIVGMRLEIKALAGALSEVKTS